MAQPRIQQFQAETSYDIAMFKEGKVTTIGDEVMRFVPVRSLTIPANFVGSEGNSRTVTAAAASFNIYNGLTHIGTATFAPGAVVATFSLGVAGPGPFVLNPADRMAIIATTADANQEDISIVIKAEVS